MTAVTSFGVWGERPWPCRRVQRGTLCRPGCEGGVWPWELFGGRWYWLGVFGGGKGGSGFVGVPRHKKVKFVWQKDVCMMTSYWLLDTILMSKFVKGFV